MNHSGWPLDRESPVRCRVPALFHIFGDIDRLRRPDQSRNCCSEVVDLTHQHTNHTVPVEGPEIMIRPVGTRMVTGGSR